MSKSKKTLLLPPAAQKPASLDQEAVDLHRRIAECEDGAAPLYLELGTVLEAIQVERDLDWKGLLAYADDTLGLRRSRVVRARRIHKFHQEHPEQDINGLTVYEALQHEPKEPHKPQPKGSPLTGWEYQATQRYMKAVGNDLQRAGELLIRIVKNGEKPAKGKGGKRPRLGPIVKVFAGKVRKDVSKDARGFVGEFVGKVQKADEEYTRQTNEAIAAATTDEAKANLVSVLGALKKERDADWGEAGAIVSRKHIDRYDHDEMAFVADVQRMLNEALGIPPAAEQPAASLSAPSAN